MLTWSLSRRWLALGVTAPIYSAALVVARGRPSVESDSGIFLSVAARLAHGDRLYSGVWDNKPPFFYHTQALAFEVASWRGPFLLDVVWVTVAAVSMWLLLEAIGASSLTTVAGAVVYPLLLTGAWYQAGYSELPALALAPLLAWLWLRGSPAAAGALLAVVAFFRLDYGLVFLALLAAPVFARAIDGETLRRSVPRLAAGFAAVVAATAALLASRGELAGYARTMKSNVGYPGRALGQVESHAGVVGHSRLVLATIADDRPRAVVFGLAVVAALATLLAAHRRRRAGTLAAFLVATALASAATLALTALWTHHLELIALPGAFAACVLVSQLDATAWSRMPRLGAMAGASAICVVGFGGLSLDAPSSPAASRPLSDWTRTPRSVSALALDEATAESRGRVAYARLGSADDDGHAAFSDQKLELACPVFHQYPFSSNLGQVVDCIRNRRPQLLLVGPYFVPREGPTMGRWNAFVAESRRLLSARYVRAVARRDGGGTVEIWRLRGAPR